MNNNDRKKSDILIFQYRKRKDPLRENIVVSKDNIVPTLTSSMGMGGDNIPYIFQWQRNYMRKNRNNLSPTLTGSNIPIINGKDYTLSEKAWNRLQSKKQKQLAKGNTYGYALINKNSPHSGTLTARYYKDGCEILVEQQGNRPRKLTPRECARLQGFPEEFQIVCSDSQSYKQFGNSVTITLLKKIAESILKTTRTTEKKFNNYPKYILFLEENKKKD
jgi:site-specific DNA-cytosine methylase